MRLKAFSRLVWPRQIRSSAACALAILGAGSAFAGCTTGTNTETCTFSGSAIASFGPNFNDMTTIVTKTSTVTVPSSVITGPITNVTITISGLNATEGFSSLGLNYFSFLLAPPSVSSSEKPSTS